MAKQDPSDDDLTVHRTSDFLAEQGIADPDEFRVKSHLCNEIQAIAEKRGLASTELARLAGVSDREAAAVLRSRHDGIEVWHLFRMLSALGADVGIYVLPDSGRERGIVLSDTVREAQVRTAKATVELTDEEMRLIRAARTPPEHDYDYAESQEVGMEVPVEIDAGPESFPESAVARVREVAESHPEIDVEIGGGLRNELNNRA